jgi:long-chain acyl-CoA synthetase
MSTVVPYPRGVPRSINYPEIPLHALLENSARKYPNRDAIVFYGRKLIYARLWDSTRRFASALRDLGIEKGDRVGLLMPNVPQFVIVYYAILVAGGVVVAVNPLNSTDEVGRQLGETGAKVLVALDRFLDKVRQTECSLIVAKAETYLPLHLRLPSNLKRVHDRPSGIEFERLLKSSPAMDAVEIDPRHDLAAIQYTEGTTGHPKGVMLTHFSLVSNALQTFHWLRGWGFGAKPQLAGRPIVVCAIPFFHIYGMTVGLNEPVHFGSTLVLVPDPKPEHIMRAIHRHRATHLPAIPAMISGIVEHPRRNDYDLASLTDCVSGGAPLDQEVAKKFIQITGARLFQGYGLTEAGPVTHCTPVDGDPLPQSVGLPMPDTEAKIVDAQLGEVEVSPGREGELIVRGPQVMSGYWSDAEATAAALRNGWLHTGDIARLEEEGFLHIVGRKQERIVSSGHVVWPSLVEEVLRTHPAVEAAAALGVLDPLRCATDVRAIVTLRAGWDLDETRRSLMELCGKRLEPYQVPSEISIVSSMPTTPLGKIDKRALAQDFERSEGLA